MSRKTYFTDVLLPLPIPGYYTYRVPFELNGMVQVGTRVAVQFGRKKIFTALVRRIHENPPLDYTPKYILSIVDEKPIVVTSQFTFWEWMASYYMCSPGEVMNAALPSGLKLASESRIMLNPAFDGDLSDLNEKEVLIADALTAQSNLTIDDVMKIVDQAKVLPLIKTLIEKEVVEIEEELVERYKPKTENYIRLGDKYLQDENKLRQVFDDLGKRAFKQLQLMMSFINLTRNQDIQVSEIKRSVLLKSVNASSSALKALIDKEILESFSQVESRLGTYAASASPEDICLTEHQQDAYHSIKDQFKAKDTILLHGITSSGKTEIYIKLISEAISQGKQVLYLLPEIGLTSQIINRLRKYFGDLVGVYHSRYNEQERVETWNRVLQPQPGRLPEDARPCQVILGARSALFLPYANLGLIIVDEEHDTSYKQFDPAPRYNARDASLYLARMHQAKALLGSATPAIETYQNTKLGKFGLATLTQRYGGMQMPEIIIADLRKEAREKTMHAFFTSTLLSHIKAALKEKEQVILFQNRRGFSLHLECSSCQWVPMCKYCDISLTYHKYFNKLICHYCGYSIKVPETCPECKSPALSMKGFGTERIEEELKILIPAARIQRMDLDATRTKYAHQTIIENFETQRIDILVGTQMVTKGLDFDNVSIVGIMNADNMLNFPDFRSYERSFQLMAQVSGRAGRKKKRGKVIIQTGRPDHEIIRYVIPNDYLSMFKSQLVERHRFKYPPFVKLIVLKLKHKDASLLNRAAQSLATDLRAVFGKRVLGPEYPLVSRIKSYYIKNILIKAEKSVVHAEIKKQLAERIVLFNKSTSYKSIRVVIDVDPL